MVASSGPGCFVYFCITRPVFVPRTSPLRAGVPVLPEPLREPNRGTFASVISSFVHSDELYSLGNSLFHFIFHFLDGRETARKQRNTLEIDRGMEDKEDYEPGWASISTAL